MNKTIFNFIFLITIVSMNFSTLAINYDIKQPIHIESRIQSINMQKNIITFVGNVVLTQGTIKINADKIIISNLDKKQNKRVIDGYGHPAVFYQIQNNGKLLRGYASAVHYAPEKDYIVLNKDVYFEQIGSSSITCDNIIYLPKKQKVQAYSKKGKRVVTVLIPSQLWNKK